MKARLLKLIAAVPAGEKLPVSRLARELDASPAVVVDLVQALVAEGKLDRETLRPPAESPSDGGGQLLAEIRAFCERTGVKESNFGRDATGDVALVWGLRKGRNPKPATVERVREFITNYMPEEQEHAPASEGGDEPTGKDSGSCEDGGQPSAKAPPSSPSVAQVVLPDRPSGQDLHDAVCAAAHARGMKLTAFARGLAAEPPSYLRQLAAAKNPKPYTVERIRALLEGRPVPPQRPKPEGVVTCRRSDREALGLEPSRRGVVEERSLSFALERREREEEALAEAEVARANRLPGETLAEAVARAAREREDRFRNATRLTTAHPLEPKPEPLDSPSSVLRQAQRDWPDQCARVKAIAEEIGVSLAEAWRRVIAAGVECLSDPEAV